MKCNVDSVLEGLALRIPKSVGSGVVVQVRSISDGQRLRNSSSRVVCTMLPIQEGLQKLPAIELTNQQDGRVLDTVDVECFVKQKCCIIVCT